MLNYINLLFLFLTLLIITGILYYFNLYHISQTNNISSYKFTENFNSYSSNLILDSITSNNNFLQNSSQNIRSVVMQNPGISSKVLEITNNNNKSTNISKITVNNVENNSTYKLNFWYAFKNGTNLNNLTIIKLFNFYVNTENINNRKIIPSKASDIGINHSIINKIEWTNVSYLVELPEIKQNKLHIILSTNSNIKADKIYLTNITLTKILENNPNFKITKDLKLLIDINSVTPNSYILKDQSNNGNDFTTINGDKLNYNIIDNKFSLYNNIFESSIPASNIIGIQPDELTISMYISIKQQALYKNIISIPGNQGNTISISIDNLQDNGVIIVDLLNNITLSTSNKSLVLGNTLITITYSDKKKKLSIWQEDTIIASLDVDVNLLPSSQKNMKINLKNSKTAHPNLIGLAIYTTTILNTNDITTISNYYQNQRKLDRPSVVKHILSNPLDDNNLDNSTDENSNNNNFNKNNNDAFFLFIDPTDPSKLNTDYHNNNYINSENTVDISNQNIPSYLKKLKLQCKDAIKRDCGDIDNEYQYNKCVRDLDINNTSCLNYCNITNNSNTNLCKLDDFKCPYVYIKDNSYFVHIPKNCKYYKYLNKDDIDYGSNRHKAMLLFERNFPDCDIPNILKYPDGNHPSKNCPFKLHDGNPCNDTVCNDVNWKYPIQDQEVCKECKYSIAHYCKKNAEVDDSCICWSDEYKDLAECKAFRKFYEDPNDYQCNIDKFNIEEHPDFPKYIKRDNIPCWNCNLITPNTNFKRVGNRYNR